MKKMLAVFLFSLLLLMTAGWQLTASPAGQTPSQPKVPYRIPFTAEKIHIDGVLDEPVWQTATKFELKYEVNPGENTPAPVKTEVFMVYSTTTLYIGYKAYDPRPEEIRAHYYDRDKMYNDDWVGVVLDTNNDNRRGFDFFSNPLGIQGEIIESWEGGGDNWDAIWDCAGKINKEGYFVEFAIPFSVLRFPKTGQDQIWGIDLVRMYTRSSRHHIGLFPRSRNNNCYLCQAEKIIGFGNVKPGNSIELDPTLSGIYTEEREKYNSGDYHKLESRIDPGITARWNLTSSLILNATINPDFSNVEADGAQLDVNRMFALEYPEKRPFFLEGVNTFVTRLRAVNTRTLADPDWGIKLTGKAGKNTLGFFTVQDNITNLIFPYNQGNDAATMDTHSIGTVLRYRRDVGRTSNVGLLITDREATDYHNRLVGLDADLKFNRKDRLRLQYMGSDTKYPTLVAKKHGQSQDNFWGNAYDVSYIHDSREWDWFATYRDITANFRADLGFMPQADYRDMRAGVSRTWFHNPGFWFTKITGGVNGSMQFDHQDLPLEKKLSFYVTYEGPMLSYLTVTANLSKLTYWYKDFPNSTIALRGGFRSGTFAFDVLSAFGSEVDLMNVQKGKIFFLNPNMEFQLGAHLNVAFEHILEHMNVPRGDLYDANISKLKLVYNFNRRTFLRLFLQYVNYQFEPKNYRYKVDPEYKQFFPQVLFSYKINPQTVLYLGYFQEYKANMIVERLKPRRSIFVKIGYALSM